MKSIIQAPLGRQLGRWKCLKVSFSERFSPSVDVARRNFCRRITARRKGKNPPRKWEQRVKAQHPEVLGGSALSH